jgi:CRP-like cAMP-binding protein
MSSFFAPNVSIKNRLLVALPRKEYERLLPLLKLTQLPQGMVLYHAGDLMRSAYFINDGLISLLSTAQDGSSVETAVVGSEGLIGIPIVLRSNKTPYEVKVQIAVKSSLMIDAEALRNEFDRGDKLQELLLHYTHVLLTQISQTALCNRFHTVEQRLVRWLLIATSRVNSNRINFTQEIISQILGSQRTGVTAAACHLQDKGLIRYSRGKIKVLNRQGLEAIACECFKVIQEEFDRFLYVEASK